MNVGGEKFGARLREAIIRVKSIQSFAKIVSRPSFPRRKSLLYKVYSWCRGWYPSHALGLTLLALPALCALANFQGCNSIDIFEWS